MQQKSNIFSTAKERLLQYLDCKGISQYQFSKETGLSNGFLKSGSSISSDNLKLLSSIFIDINLLWVITGDGEMLIEKKCTPECTPECTPVENFNEKNAQVNAQVNAQAITKSPGVISSQRDIPTFQAREVQRGGIPLIPLEAAAGILSGTEVQIMDYECEHFVIPGFKNADFMIQITGDSMLPKYESGDVVACQRLPMSTFFQWNCVYVVDSEQGILIKRVKQGSDKEHIELVSENEKYGAFELHLGDINGLGRVVGLVRFE